MDHLRDLLLLERARTNRRLAGELQQRAREVALLVALTADEVARVCDQIGLSADPTRGARARERAGRARRFAGTQRATLAPR